ncbi:MAG TPA: Uma2 family endonuclease [Egibacteraceae bacterium]|nr:Uma2 family endonuclease [Egibacteraceae bacterium]
MPQPAKLTYDDLQRFPDDGLRRELIDGELFVTPAPATRHQLTVTCFVGLLYNYSQERGGVVLSAPYDVKFSIHDVTEPDVLFVREPRRLGEKYLDTSPDLAVEVSSPSTKGVDRIRKRALYERFGVPEYWIVDLDHDVIEAYVLRNGRYGEPTLFRRGDTVTATALPGFSAAFDRLVPPA